MNRQLSMPEYYKLQGMLAERHNIEEFHAGCYITHYPDNNLCNRCTRLKQCEQIRDVRIKELFDKP